MKKLILVVAPIVMGFAAGALAEDGIKNLPQVSTFPAQEIGIEMLGKSNISRLMWFDLSDGANSMLHGYIPQSGDTVEWYIREADCEEPAKSCKFELAIRKKQNVNP